jgi:hypothetical protein
MKVEFEKGPGWDWEVFYDAGEGEEVMMVFGQIRIEDAISEARWSFEAPAKALGFLTDYEILGVRRV